VRTRVGYIRYRFEAVPYIYRVSIPPTKLYGIYTRTRDFAKTLSAEFSKLQRTVDTNL
jgi:hypothetical protein